MKNWACWVVCGWEIDANREGGHGILGGQGGQGGVVGGVGGRLLICLIFGWHLRTGQ